MWRPTNRVNSVIIAPSPIRRGDEIYRHISGPLNAHNARETDTPKAFLPPSVQATRIVKGLYSHGLIYRTANNFITLLILEQGRLFDIDTTSAKGSYPAN
jgi:hypothetical protein